MKERSKERMSELLMEELLAQLGERESLKRKLGDMTGLPVDDLIERLLEDFEQIVEKRRLESLEQVKQRKERQSKDKQDIQTPISSPEQVVNPLQVQDEQVAEAVLPSPTSTEQHHTTTEPGGESVLDPVFSRPPQADAPSEETALLSHTEPTAVEIEEPPSDLPTPSEPQEQTEEELFLFQRGLQELAKKVNNEGSESLETELKEESESVVEERSIDLPGMVDEEIDSLLTPKEVEEDDVEEAASVDEELFQLSKPPRTPFKLEDEDYLYVHGVSMVPEGDSASREPFMLEEKGIDARGFAFAIDYSGLRFYLSKINLDQMNVSKTGVLLLGKQESIQTQGTHESILNELRGHGVLLPFEFGTVVRGTDELLTKIDDRYDGIKEALEQLMATTWWTLNVYVLDSRIARVLGTASSRSHEDRMTSRASYSPPLHQKKYDIKELEKILSKEKKIAEYIHQELSKVSVRSDIDMIVGFGSGSSEDWKQILKASYEVQPGEAPKLFRAVTDHQYHHILFDLMLSLSGDRESYSFKEK